MAVPSALLRDVDVDVDVGVDDAARAILAPLFAHRRVQGGAREASVASLAPHLPRARAFVVEHQPVTVVLPAFPAKSPSRHKVLGPLPDVAERLSLRFLARVVDDIARVHPPGARLVVCSDGAVFADVVGVHDAAVVAYRTALARMIEVEARGRIELFDLKDAFPDVDVTAARARLLGRALSTQEIQQRALSSSAARAQLDGIHRFLFEELLLEDETLSRSRARALTRERAVEVVRRSDAWSHVVDDAFPGALRLSIHPQPEVSEKIGIHIMATKDAWLTPWHGVAVLRAGRFELMKRSTAEQLGARVVVDGGVPTHMEIRLSVVVQTRALAPFGLEVTTTVGARLFDVDKDQLAGWVREHRVVVLRGLTALGKLELPRAARQWGPLQAWEFGSIHELVVKQDATNYLYTNHAVPLHWDGAFVGRAPHFLVFQCLAAPEGVDVDGATVFVDTTRVWSAADEVTRDRWRALTFEYSTDKIAHYGGSFRARVVAQHEEHSAETVLRFAEPVDDLNPVQVEAVGVSPLESAALIGELRVALANKAAVYEHAWQAGDVVIADNLALLHGRRAFARAAPRRVWRVNVHRQRARTMASVLRDSLRIRRPEFMIAEIPIFLIPLLLAGDVTAVNGAPALLVLPLVAVFTLLFHFGDMVNCYADRDLDAVFKTQQSEAIYGLGLRNVRWQIGVTVVVALLLALHLSLSIGRCDPLVLVGAGLVWGAQYSLRPLWLKGRGLLQVVTLCAIIFVGPMLLVTRTLSSTTSWTLLALFAAYAVMQEGIILVNTAEDIPEDDEAGIRTAAVALGLRRTLLLAVLMTVGGGVAVLGLLAANAASGSAGHPHPGLPSFTLVPLALAIGWAGLGVAGTSSSSIQELRKRSRWMPAWIAATAWATLVAAVGAGPWLLP